jgi:hypothetical protein
VRFLALGAALAVCACGTSFDHVDYAPIGGVPDGVLLQPTLVSLPVGVSVAARIIAVDDSGATMQCEPTLVADDSSIMTVERADRGSTVFSGVSAGQTPIVVHCGGEDGVISGRVTSAAK